MTASSPNRGRATGAGPTRLAAPHGRRSAAGWLCDRVLARIDAGLAAGRIDVALPDGSRRRLGGRRPGPAATVELRRWKALLRLASGGSAGWYEAWARGEWASPDPVALFELFVRNRGPLGDTARPSGWGRLVRRAWHALRRNDRRRAQRNIIFHYDLGNDFYAPWLDATMTYSSALFADVTDPSEPLEAAQRRKLSAILDRTSARAGDRVLEIGCGWGSFAAVASAAGVRVHGITLSREQKQLVDAHGLDGVEVTLTDYRDVAGTYDAVASIEMVEAVGQEYWGDYLSTIAAVLRPGGRAALQLIAIDDAIFDAYARNVDFIQRYVFPGGMLISESRFRALAEARGLAWTDRLGFGGHYAETLRRWRERFDAAYAAGALPGEFDERFADLWRYYLMYCEGGFRGGGIDVVQVTLVKAG